MGKCPKKGEKGQAALSYLLVTSIILASIVIVLSLSSGMFTTMKQRSEMEVVTARIREILACVQDSAKSVGMRSIDLGELPAPIRIREKAYAVSVSVEIVDPSSSTVITTFVPYGGACGDIESKVGIKARGIPYYLVGRSGEYMAMFNETLYVLLYAVEGGNEVIRGYPIVGLEYSKLPIRGGNHKHTLRIYVTEFRNGVTMKRGTLTLTSSKTEEIILRTDLDGNYYVDIVVAFGASRQAVRMQANVGDELVVSTVLTAIRFAL